MKKTEAMKLAPESSKLIIENIIQVLLYPEKVDGVMNFGSSKVDNQLICVLDIPKKNLQNCLNLGISSEHILVLYEQLLNDLLDVFLEHETMGVSKYYSLKSQAENFTGINAVNLLGSKIKINLNSSRTEFMKLIDRYSEIYREFEESLSQEKAKLR